LWSFYLSKDKSTAIQEFTKSPKKTSAYSVPFEVALNGALAEEIDNCKVHEIHHTLPGS
jgi:hypothetical protein